MLPLTFSRSFPLFFCRFLHLLQVEVWIIHKRVFARGIINFDFLSFVDKGCRVLPQRLSVHDTIVQRIWFYLSCWVGSKYSRAGERYQPEQDQDESRPEDAEF